MKLSFLTRSVGPLVLGGGLGVGGVALYKNTTPYTWKELLAREGIYLIHEDGDYKAIFYDQENIRKNISDLKDASSVSSDYEKIKKYCQQQLDKTPDKGNGFESTKQNLIDLCSHKGITSIRGRIAQLDKTNWISDQASDKENKYKAIFAIYRYYEPFLDWLNEDKEGSSKLSKEDLPSTKYQELENKCTSIIKKSYSSSDNSGLYNYVYWWCQPLPYETVENKIKHEDTSWEKRTDWQEVPGIWSNTASVTSAVKGDSSETPDSSKYQSWCEEQLKKNLHEDGVYQEQYLIVKSVCRKPKQ